MILDAQGEKPSIPSWLHSLGGNRSEFEGVGSFTGGGGKTTPLLLE